MLALAWRWSAAALAPVLPLHLRRRAARGKEDPARLAERYGHGAARPPGRLVWLHAASVGETMSVLPLIEALAARDPALHVLVTTGTVTSARLLADRLPAALAPRVAHRFVPLDVPRWVARFLDGWRPDAAVFVESELWPNLVAATASRGIPMALVNARMSARAARRWARAPGLARRVISAFRLVLAQTEADAARFRGLGAPGATCPGNLKYAAPPLPADDAEAARLAALFGDRPAWVAASTHPGEEALVIAAHRRLAPAHPGLLTIIVPRHPERGPEVAALAREIALARRGAGQDPGPDTQILLADTLGELGLWYRLARLAFVGGSLVAHGGQNPLEPARLGCAVLVGPHTWNFTEILDRMAAAGGLVRVDPGPDPAAMLAEAVGDMLTNPGRGQAQASAAAAVAAEQAGLPDRIAAALVLLLPGPGDTSAAPGGNLAAAPALSGPPGERTRVDGT
ncbi:3-deoxy-D-manno-octulosonic acid transferase [Roseomonas sp. CECT 9278]|uniref:3-deoxy-D-manno-octulosonic acid transferase n=1 Tax=Roseomonas sp. CECT 9278 TaxID=2845823 RepID=UPI001E5B1402|nr:3-deoxy-D-manno-octulosonic acid transferase [Roseomonas sp. CECT 9278]CAH0255474.1 3-deoxy-D-manno-octulosonic acid transferase [Roseomonas sp. CECT 9278]